MKIIVFNSQSHIGGGDTYTRNIFQCYKKDYSNTQYVENKHNLIFWFFLLKKKFDGVIFNPCYPKDFSLILLTFLFSLPTITTIHGLWFLETKSMNPTQGFFKTLYFWIVQYLICIFSSRVVVVSINEKILVERYYFLVKHKVTLIPGAANHRIFKTTTQSISSIRKNINLPLNKKVLLMVTRIERRKSIEVALQALYHVKKKFPEVTLIIVFPSSHFNQLDYLNEQFQLVKELNLGMKVQFRTGLSKEQLVPLYQSSNIFLMSSKELENFSLSVIESLSCGCPVLSFNSGGTPKLLNKINTKLVIDKFSPISLAKRINWYLALSTPQQEKFRKRSTQVAHSFSWEKSYYSFVQLFSEINPQLHKL